MTQEAKWTTQQAFPIVNLPVLRQRAVWDEPQRPGIAARRSSHLFVQGLAYAPFAQTPPRRDVSGDICLLQQYYLLADDGPDFVQLLERYSGLSALLAEAVRPLQAAFGDRLFHLRVQNSDEDSLVRVTVRLPVNYEHPEIALSAFDNSWWLNNCHRSSGILVIDYEIQDAV